MLYDGRSKRRLCRPDPGRAGHGLGAGSLAAADRQLGQSTKSGEETDEGPKDLGGGSCPGS